MIFLCITLIILLFILLITCDNAITLILTIISIILSIVLMTYYNLNPKAIDVYRGKTTLEIVYRDNVPIDSTVIFKK